MKLYIHDGMYYRAGTQPKGATKVDVPTDAAGLVDYLNAYGTGVSTRIAEAKPVVTDVQTPVPAPLAMEDAFEALPLATKLHYASLALEEARMAIKPRTAPAKPQPIDTGEDLL